jgi:hypothetical protein
MGSASSWALRSALLYLSFAAIAHGRSKKRSKAKSGGANKLDPETESLLQQTGVSRQVFEKIVDIGRLRVSESEWDTRNSLPGETKTTYMQTQRAVARGIITQGPDVVEKYTAPGVNDDVAGIWSNTAMQVFKHDIKYQWGPTSTDWYSVPEPYPNEVKKISANGLSYEQLLSNWDGAEPVLLTDVSYPALNWTKSWIVEQIAKLKIKIQMRVPGPSWANDGNSHKFYVIEPLESFAEVVAQSGGIKWTYSMDEEFFFEEQMGIPGWMKKQVDPGATLPQWDHTVAEERDLFQKFPQLAQPNNMMLLWGGAQSRSLLHVDPYNWTGTNGVIYGEKYWKFYPPSFDGIEGLHGKGETSQGYINTPHYFSPIDAWAPDIHRYPDFLEAEKHCIHGRQGPGEVMLIPSGWWHDAYNPVETFAFSSEFLNPQNYRPALHALITGNPVVAACAVKNNVVVPAVDGRRDHTGGRTDYDWVRPELKPPYNTEADTQQAIAEFDEVMACLESEMEATPIPGKEHVGKTSSLIWGPKSERARYRQMAAALGKEKTGTRKEDL